MDNEKYTRNVSKMKAIYRFSLENSHDFRDRKFKSVMRTIYIGGHRFCYCGYRPSPDGPIYEINGYDTVTNTHMSLSPEIMGNERDAFFRIPYFAYVEPSSTVGDNGESGGSGRILYPEFSSEGNGVGVKTVSIDNPGDEMWWGGRSFQSICNIKILNGFVFVFDTFKHTIHIHTLTGEPVKEIITPYDFPVDLIETPKGEYLVYFFKGNPQYWKWSRKEEPKQELALFNTDTKEWKSMDQLLEWKDFRWMLWLNSGPDGYFMSYEKVICKFDWDHQLVFRRNFAWDIELAHSGNAVTDVRGNKLLLNFNGGKQIFEYSI